MFVAVVVHDNVVCFVWFRRDVFPLSDYGPLAAESARQGQDCDPLSDSVVRSDQFPRELLGADR